MLNTHSVLPFCQLLSLLLSKLCSWDEIKEKELCLNISQFSYLSGSNVKWELDCTNGKIWNIINEFNEKMIAVYNSSYCHFIFVENILEVTYLSINIKSTNFRPTLDNHLTVQCAFYENFTL